MADALGEAYRIHVWIRQISPMIWRRLLVGSDSSIADLHHTLQIAFGWSDSHLHRFHIHGRDYGIGKIGGIGFSTHAKQVRLADFRFRINERFLYEYDFGDAWQHEVRIEERLPLDDTGVYPRCIGGRRQAPRKIAAVPWHSWRSGTACQFRSTNCFGSFKRTYELAISRPFEIARQRSTPCPNGWRSKLSIGERSTVGSSNTR